MKNMPHPLFTLISQETETASESSGIASGTSVAECSPVADRPQQKSRGDAEGVGGGDGAGVAMTVVSAAVGRSMAPRVVGGVPSPTPDHVNPWQPAAGLSILAVLDPPGTDGRPGQARFAPGLTLAERREILLDDEWFAVRIRRRAAEAEVAADGCRECAAKEME